MMSYNTYKLDEKYRPAEFVDCIGNPRIIADIAQFVETRQIPHLLLCGVQGTGKTSTAYVILRKLYGANMKSRFIEINASNDSRIEVIRTRIKDFAMHSNADKETEFRIVLLEEADEIPPKSQAALRRLMETYSKHCRFILTCNYRWKIILPVQSRCSVFEYAQITPEQMLPRLQYVCNTENIHIDAEALRYIAEKSKGDMRTALNTYLERLRTVNKQITLQMIQSFQIDGNGILGVLKHALNKRLNPAIQTYLTLAQKGLQVRDFINRLNLIIQEQAYPDLMKAELFVMLLEAEQAIINGSQENQVITFILGKACLIGNMYRKKDA